MPEMTDQEVFGTVPQPVGSGHEMSDADVFSAPQGISEPKKVDEAVAQKQQYAITGAKRGFVGGLGTLGDVSSFLSNLFGVNPELAAKFRGFPTSQEVGKKLEPVIGKVEGEGSDVTEFLANPLSYLGPGGLVRKLGGALAGGVGAETGKAVAGTPGEVVGGILGGGLAGIGGGVPKATAAEKASGEILEKLKADQVTPQQISDLAKTRPGVARPMDLGGPAIASEVERLGQTSPAGRQIMAPFLTERQKGSLARIHQDLTELTGSTRTAYQATQQVMAERAAASAPAYRAAYDAGDRVVWSDMLERLTGVPEVQQAMHSAVAGWQRSQFVQGYGALNPGAMVEGGGLLKFLHGKVPVFPNLQFWDYAKNALDAMVSDEIKEGKMSRRGRDLTIIASTLRKELDKEVPEYEAARQAWAGPSSYLNALEEGRNIFNRTESAEEMAANFNELSEVDKQAYREAVVSSILSKMQNNTAKLPDLSRELRSPAMRAKIATILPTPEAKAAWENRLNFEIQSSERVAGGLGGSQTARRLSQMEEANADIATIAFEVVKKSKSAVIVDALRQGYERAKASLRKEIDKESAKILTGQQPITPPRAAPTVGDRLAGPSSGAIRNLLITLGGQNAGQ